MASIDDQDTPVTDSAMSKRPLSLRLANDCRRVAVRTCSISGTPSNSIANSLVLASLLSVRLKSYPALWPIGCVSPMGLTGWLLLNERRLLDERTWPMRTPVSLTGVKDRPCKSGKTVERVKEFGRIQSIFIWESAPHSVI